MNATADLRTASQKIYDILANKKAPAVIGQPVFEKHFESARLITGAKSFADMFGHKEISDAKPIPPSLNFGSRKSTGHLPEETRLMLFGLKQLISDVEIQACIMFKKAHVTAQEMMETPVYKDRLAPMLKAFNVTDFSSFIQTVNARFYFEEYEIPLLVGDLFDQMTMESSSMQVDGILGRLFGRLETDVATFGEQSNTQSSYPVVSKNNVVHAAITEDLNQDSAPAIIDKFRKEVIQGVARSEERGYLDGDDSVTHMDADVTAATDWRKAHKGLRKRGLDNSANDSVIDHNGDVASKLLFSSMMRAMGKFASEKADLAYIIGPVIGTDLVTGAIPELFTAFAFGSPASNVTGQVPPVFGVKCYESEWMREDLAATGVYTAPGETKTWAALVKKSRFQRWMRAPIRVWAAPSLPSSDRMLMTAKKRHTFGGVPQTADEKSLIIAINIESAPS